MRRRLEAAGLMLVRTGAGAGLAEEIDEPMLTARRYEIAPGSRAFELLIFPSRAILQRALDDLRAPTCSVTVLAALGMGGCAGDRDGAEVRDRPERASTVGAGGADGGTIA